MTIPRRAERAYAQNPAPHRERQAARACPSPSGHPHHLFSEGGDNGQRAWLGRPAIMHNRAMVALFLSLIGALRSAFRPLRSRPHRRHGLSRHVIAYGLHDVQASGFQFFAHGNQLAGQIPAPTVAANLAGASL